MNHSSLSDHKFKKGKFITPWNEIMDSLSREESWFHGRLPEYIWLGLIINEYGREEGFKKCHGILNKLHNLLPAQYVPRFSSVLNMEEQKQKEFYSYIVEIIPVTVISPLTTIFTFSQFPCFSTTFALGRQSISERHNKISLVLDKASDHQTHFSTDIRFLVLYFQLLSGRLHIPKEVIDLILEYPHLSHEDEKMRMIRPTVRSMEMTHNMLEPSDANYIDMFWEAVSRMSNCKIIKIDYKLENSDTNLYIDKVEAILRYYSELLKSSSPLDNKMLVLFGITTFSYKRLVEVVKHNLYNAIAGRSVVRVLVEDYIMIKYLLKEEAAHADIWTEYQYYGIGQYKLVVERILEYGKDDSDSHINVKYLDALVNEYHNKEFIDMDTSYFDNKNVRKKAIYVGEKDLFDQYYDYDSAFEHGLWGAIRESSLLKCMSPAHQYHCVPDYEGAQNMKSVWHDCVQVMNKTLAVLENTYGLPSYLKIEDQ